MEIPKGSIKPRGMLRMKIKSMAHSEVSLLAIDKSVTTLATGNDLEMSDFIKIYGNYDSDIQIKTYDFSSPRACTKEDNDLLQLIPKSDTAQQSSLIEQEAVTIISNNDENDELQHQKDGNTKFVRSNFPETWLYDTMYMESKESIQLLLTVPDTITTWIFTAFSLNKNGFALAKPQTQLVKQNFFVKVNVPYEGRVGEIITIDAIVFNFLDQKEDVNATVTFNIINENDMYDLIEKIERNQSCQNKETSVNGKEIFVKHGQGNKVSFDFIPKKTGKIVFAMTAEETKSEERDAVFRSINIINIGIKEIVNQKVYNTLTTPGIYEKELKFDNCTTLSVGVAGDIVSNAFSYNDELEYDCLCNQGLKSLIKFFFVETFQEDVESRQHQILIEIC